MPSDEDIPIDIYYNKLLDWLIDRRHCNLKWQENVSSIREKINFAMQDMPPNKEITSLLSGTYINYFHCKQIIELLKECGEGNTNFFGQYSSKRMKDWQDIIQLYTHESVYLAESANMLIRNVNFEIPALKRQIGKCQQIQRDCSRKINECTTNSAYFMDKYKTICKQIGIKGTNVRKELLEQVNELPGIFGSITGKLKEISDVLNFYRAFVKFITQSEFVVVENICSMIHFLMVYGNVTVYQWKTGEVPSKVIDSIKSVDMDEMIKLSEGSFTQEDNQEEIDWGCDLNTENLEVGGEDIDWGTCEVLDNSVAAITVEEDGQDNPIGGVASGNEALNVLENTSTRNIFIDELYEVQSFLEQRVIEMSSDADMITICQFQLAPEIVQNQTKEWLLLQLSRVTSILSEMTSLKMQNLYLIQNSPRYVDRIADSLIQKLTTSENLMKQINILEERSQKAQTLQAETEPKLEVIIRKTKELQKQIEKEISVRYKDRRVNIMGEINVI
nr:CDK5 regulatory subunit-associated protein 3 [Hydra vulgaris]